jgi:CRISPR-associated protein Cmx8
MGTVKAKAAPIAEVVVKYDLLELPTAQHKAGLAGLLLQIRHMEKRQRDFPEGAIPAIEETTGTSATVRFTERSVKGLFDDLYDARVERVTVKSKWQGQAPLETLEEEEVDPETKTSRRVKKFVYEVVQPCGHFLRDQLPQMDRNKDWHKLWRDMLWAIPRGNPQSRLPFEDRAGGQPCREGPAAWAALVKVEQARRKNRFYTAEVAGSLWLGAQALNAETIPFVGRAEQNLLLHFWPLTVLIFVPQQIGADGTAEFVGYVLAIPEVGDLEEFLAENPQLLSELGTDVRGYRPAEAIIDLPAQGALAFLEHLARLTAAAAEQQKFRTVVTSVEYLHLAKFGNNIKSMAAGRVAPDLGLVERYRAIAGTPDKPSPYRNPLFRRGLLQALLEGREWYGCMAPMLVERPWPLFLRSEDSTRQMPWFWLDVARMFQSEADDHAQQLQRYQEMMQTDPGTVGKKPQTPLPVVINRVVRAYLFGRAKEKSGIDPNQFRNDKGEIDWDKVPPAFKEEKTKLAQGTFLEFRSRREQAFVDHFVATFCSVKQYLSDDDYQTVAAALLDREHDCRDDVKTLTLLALSANS